MSTKIAAGPVPMPRPTQITFTHGYLGRYFATWPGEKGWIVHECKNWGAAMDLFTQAMQPEPPAWTKAA